MEGGEEGETLPQTLRALNSEVKVDASVKV